jgi:DNA helicase HerA-like ATPase
MTKSDDAQAAAEAAAQAAEEAEQAAQAARERAQQLAEAAQDAEDDESAETSQKPAATPDIVDIVRKGHAIEGPALEIGALVADGAAVPQAQVRIPLAMLNRHGLVAGATGTGKTKTLQVLAEQISTHGVPVFAADIKGDLSGIATPGQVSDKLLERTKSIGQDWQGAATPVEYFTLGGLGTGVPVRASIESFGPILLAKVLGLNETQESSLGLVFHYAREAQLPLVDVGDLRSVLMHLNGAGKPELKKLGGLSSATVGVILRELIAFADQGADVFFGLPEITTSDFLRATPDGKGIVALLEVPSVQDKPVLFSTFLMYLLTQIFDELPEVGDVEKPKLVFFFDEAHLLFDDASDAFLDLVAQTVRLVRSKGVGVFFVTQTPKDLPAEVLEQLGSRIQHQLRAHTPDAAKALRATVSTYPNSSYDLEEVLTQLAIGEAIVTVMNEKGAPSPVAWTRVRAPQGSMEPTPAETITASVQASPLLARYGRAENPQSATELLDAKDAAAREAAEEAARQEAEAEQSWNERIKRSTRRTRTSGYRRQSPLEKAAGEAARTAAREIIRSIFSRRR